MGSFGRHRIADFALDPGITYLNHGTVGAPPRAVLERQRAIRDEIERQPSRFLLRELTRTAVVGAPLPGPSRTRAAAAAVAEFVGARGEDLVFVDNATMGANTVLRSLPLRPGDEIVTTAHVYGGVRNAARFAGRLHGATVRLVDLPDPGLGPGATADAVVGALGPRTRILVLDHITSGSALILPVREITARTRAKGIPVFVDGAHAPGAIPLDIASLDVDWYSATLHKWTFTPRSCGFLWVSRERREGLHPRVISWGLDQGLHEEFDLVGTRDPSAYLTAPDAIAWMRKEGVAEVQGYNHALVWEATQYLTRQWRTSFSAPESMIGTMATIPLPDRAGSTRADADRLRDGLLFEDRIEIELHEGNGKLWVRLSAQIYNDMTDVERLSAAILARI
ncbi:MAG: aminotransferase class V-fold PLP-dependent enzyme [Candidatus Eiseniibacteriota bacterium]